MRMFNFIKIWFDEDMSTFITDFKTLHGLSHDVTTMMNALKFSLSREINQLWYEDYEIARIVFEKILADNLLNYVIQWNVLHDMQTTQDWSVFKKGVEMLQSTSIADNKTNNAPDEKVDFITTQIGTYERQNDINTARNIIPVLRANYIETMVARFNVMLKTVFATETEYTFLFESESEL